MFGDLMGGMGAEFVKGDSPADLKHPGTGPYPAGYLTDPSLPEHTIYAPLKPPPSNVKMPVVVFGEGGCLNGGTTYSPFLTELASYGYLVIANGPPRNGPMTVVNNKINLTDLIIMTSSGQTKVQDLTDSIDWVMKGSGSKYGNIDTTKIATSGQSCGGLEAYSAAYHDERVKFIIILNSGILDDKKRYLLQELKVPIAFVLGGTKDIAYANVSLGLV
jgi:dienelactone hydrolase